MITEVINRISRDPDQLVILEALNGIWTLTAKGVRAAESIKPEEAAPLLAELEAKFPELAKQTSFAAKINFCNQIMHNLIIAERRAGRL